MCCDRPHSTVVEFKRKPLPLHAIEASLAFVASIHEHRSVSKMTAPDVKAVQAALVARKDYILNNLE